MALKRKTYNVKPTERQKKAVINIAENHGNKYKALTDAGYPHNTAKKPTNVTESKGYKMAAEPIIKKMELAREKAMNRLLDTADTASHSDANRTVDTMTKNIQLLGGKPTEIIEDRPHSDLSKEELEKRIKALESQGED